jgi:hypothetical protein
MRNLKALGLALTAVFALSAVAASAAQATGQVTADGYPAILTGIQVETNILTINGGVRNVSCSEASLEKEITGAVTDVEGIKAVYGGCTGNGETTATVNMKSCTYTLAGKSITEANKTGKGTAKVNCSTAGDGIEIDIYGKGVAHEVSKALCRFKIPAQALGGEYEWHNTNIGTSTEDILLTLTGLTVPTVHTVFAVNKITCGTVTNETATAKYDGSITVTGENKNKEHTAVMIG